MGIAKSLQWAALALVALTLTACMSEADRNEWRDAALYIYGPYQYAQNVERIRTENAARGVAFNYPLHIRNLSDHTSRRVTAPNADTLYSSAVLDISTGPVEVILPDAPDRYVSVMVMDIFTDVVDVVGSWDEARGSHFWIVKHDWTGTAPDGVNLIRVPGQDAWLLGRTFVAGPSDLDAARDVQSELIVRPVNPDATPAPWPIQTDAIPNAENAVTVVNTLLARSAGHPHTQRASAFTEKGIIPGATQSWDNLSTIEKTIWTQTFEKVEAGLKTALLRASDGTGWRTPPKNLAQFGTDDATRAAVGLIGFGALRPQDASYFTAVTDGTGEPLNGAHSYTLTFNPDAVPVDAFWSISAYLIEGDGRRFFIENPLNRHSINGDTPGLERDDSGLLTLELSVEAPDSEANWLPLPDGPVAIIFRTYRPQTAILDGQWEPPDIERASKG